MKISPIILLGSLAANGVLVAVLWLRPSTLREGQAAPAAHSNGAPGKSAKDSALQAALLSGDRAALEAAGVPQEVVRALAVGRAFDKMQLRLRALRPPVTDNTKYWRRDPGMRSDVMTKEQRMELNKAQRDFEEEMRSATGEALDALFDGRASAYAFLPPAKREQLRQIEQDYEEMQSQAYLDQEGIQLPSDREKLRLLRLEKERDIAAALTPEQREQYELRVSRTANNIRGLYGDAIGNEEVYRKVFVLQKAFDDQYNNPDAQPDGPPSPDVLRARREAEQKLQEDVRAMLNPDELAALQRANDQDYKMLGSVARRLNLPANAPDVVLASRENYAAQSMQINANPALTPAERRTQLQTLATVAQSELQGTLGMDGAQAYAQRSQWLGMLKNGSAFSTNSKDASPGSRVIGIAIFPVQPPRNATPPAGATPPKG